MNNEQDENKFGVSIVGAGKPLIIDGVDLTDKNLVIVIDSEPTLPVSLLEEKVIDKDLIKMEPLKDKENKQMKSIKSLKNQIFNKKLSSYPMNRNLKSGMIKPKGNY